MLEQEILDFMKPKISVEYRIENGFLTPGTLDNVPSEAFGAYIYQTFPIVGADGEFKIGSQAYNLYVGEMLDINDHLKTNLNAEMKSKLSQWKSSGFTKAVIPANSPTTIIPITINDTVYSSNSEMAKAIDNINSSYNSINITITNSCAEKNKVAVKKYN